MINCWKAKKRKRKKKTRISEKKHKKWKLSESCVAKAATFSGRHTSSGKSARYTCSALKAYTPIVASPVGYISLVLTEQTTVRPINHSDWSSVDLCFQINRSLWYSKPQILKWRVWPLRVTPKKCNIHHRPDRLCDLVVWKQMESSHHGVKH